MCNGLFGGSSCTWVLILVIVFLLAQNCGNDDNDCDCDCGGSVRRTSCC